jgi:hypothetical protein
LFLFSPLAFYSAGYTSLRHVFYPTETMSPAAQKTSPENPSPLNIHI